MKNADEENRMYVGVATLNPDLLVAVPNPQQQTSNRPLPTWPDPDRSEKIQSPENQGLKN